LAKEAAVSQSTSAGALDRMSILIGEWNMDINHPTLTVHGTSSFAWLNGEPLLVGRWRIDHPDFPDGVSIIGCDGNTGRIVQSYSDSRGVVRIYEMSIDSGVWRLWREAPEFSQRFLGTFSDDGRTIAATWEIADDGVTWQRDFDLTYTKISS
jgi:hypothetical protein